MDREATTFFLGGGAGARVDTGSAADGIPSAPPGPDAVYWELPDIPDSEDEDEAPPAPPPRTSEAAVASYEEPVPVEAAVHEKELAEAQAQAAAALKKVAELTELSTRQHKMLVSLREEVASLKATLASVSTRVFSSQSPD